MPKVTMVPVLGRVSEVNDGVAETPFVSCAAVILTIPPSVPRVTTVPLAGRATEVRVGVAETPFVSCAAVMLTIPPSVPRVIMVPVLGSASEVTLGVAKLKACMLHSWVPVMAVPATPINRQVLLPLLVKMMEVRVGVVLE